jgi:hypothetical protein
MLTFNQYKRKCKCCGEAFTTNKINKVYKDRTHQVYNNNQKQSEMRRKESKINQLMIATYDIYRECLGNKTTAEVTIEFLRGKGAQHRIYTHEINVDGQTIPVLYDISITKKMHLLVLKRHKGYLNIREW